LTENVRRKPYSVILFDEIEKAHPDVFNILLQLLDDGRLTDGQGRTVDFKNTMVIMTSNIGSQIIHDEFAKDEPDYNLLDKEMHDLLRNTFRPEFLNRIDESIIFHSLKEADLSKIMDIQLANVSKLLADKKMTLVVDDEAKLALAKMAYDPAFGARPLKRAIQQKLVDPLAEAILDGRFIEGAQIRWSYDKASENYSFNRLDK